MCDVFSYLMKLDDAKESRVWGRDVLNDTAKRLIDKVSFIVQFLAPLIFKSCLDLNKQSVQECWNAAITYVLLS